MHEAQPIAIFLYLKNVEGGELINHQGVSWYEHCELQFSNYQFSLDEYDHISCFITSLEVYLSKKEKLLDFQREASKESKKKMKHVIIQFSQTCQGYNSWKELFTKMAIVAKVVVSDCSFLSFWMCSLVFFQNTDVKSTDIWALIENLIKIQYRINSPLPWWCIDMTFDLKKTLNVFFHHWLSSQDMGHGTDIKIKSNVVCEEI